jgi:AraC-like DNA-binding protein
MGALRGQRAAEIAVEMEYVVVSDPRSRDRGLSARSAGGVRGLGGPTSRSYTRVQATVPDQAEGIIAEHYLPNRLHLPGSSLEMDLAGLCIGGLTAGRLSYGRHLRQVTDEAQNFHVNMPLRGRAASRCGGSEVVGTAAGQSLVFSPEAPAEITWSADCAQLCLMIPRAGLEAELERLLGRSLRARLRFEFAVAPDRDAGRLRTVLGLVAQELDLPSGLSTSDVAARHLEGLVLDGLLLGQQHNYTEATIGPSGGARGGLITRAVDLMEERPGEPWTVVGLAAELHLSVRALQAGFKRELGMAPMAYLRLVRMRRARAALREASPTETTVRAVALSLGLVHQGRFASSYRAMFAETPSETLHH